MHDLNAVKNLSLLQDKLCVEQKQYQNEKCTCIESTKFKAGIVFFIFSFRYYVMLYVTDIIKDFSQNSTFLESLFPNFQLRKCLLVLFKSDHYFPSHSAYVLTDSKSPNRKVNT